MRTSTADAPGKWRLSGWRVRAIGLAIIAVTLIISYFVLAAFLPRWWAQRIAEQAQSSIIRGSWLGVLYGTVFTLLPLLAVVVAIIVWRKLGTRVRPLAKAIVSGLIVLLGALLAAPNLMTLAIVMGGGDGAHAGERILDVEGPGFRGGTLIGVIFAIVLFLAATAGVTIWRRKRRARKSARAAAA